MLTVDKKFARRLQVARRRVITIYNRVPRLKVLTVSDDAKALCDVLDSLHDEVSRRVFPNTYKPQMTNINFTEISRQTLARATAKLDDIFAEIPPSKQYEARTAYEATRQLFDEMKAGHRQLLRLAKNGR